MSTETMSPIGSAEHNRTVARRWIDAFNARDDAAESAARTADYIAHAPDSIETESLDADAWVAFLGVFLEGFPDLPVGDVVEHPGPQRDAAVRGGDDLQRARLLGMVDERRGADQPVATAGGGAPRHDPVAMRVTPDRREHPRVAVEHAQQRAAA